MAVKPTTKEMARSLLAFIRARAAAAGERAAVAHLMGKYHCSAEDARGVLGKLQRGGYVACEHSIYRPSRGKK